MTDADLPDALVDYLDQRRLDRNAQTAAVFASMTNHQQRLVREAAVMGWVQGMRHHDLEIPRDSQITAIVVEACIAFDDRYPTIGRRRPRRTTTPPEEAQL